MNNIKNNLAFISFIRANNFEFCIVILNFDFYILNFLYDSVSKRLKNL